MIPLRFWNAFLDRSVGIIPLLFGPYYNLMVFPSVAYPAAPAFRSLDSHVRNFDSATLRERESRGISLTQRYVGTNHDDSGAYPLRAAVGGETASDLPRASFSLCIKSPEKMEETGAFFGRDSQEGDVILLSG